MFAPSLVQIYKPKFKTRQGDWKEGAYYWVRFSCNGKLTRATLRTKDKRVAVIRAGELVKKVERKALGLADPFEDHRDRPSAVAIEASHHPRAIRARTRSK